MSADPTIRPRDRDAIINCLAAGVVPTSGHHLIQVGRAREIEAMVQDIDRIADGGAAFRLVVGRYGSGKTFFLNLARSVALDKKLVTMHADLSPGKRLHGSDGQGRALYAELTANASTRARPGGGALGAVVERFINTAISDSRTLGVPEQTIIDERLQSLSELPEGFAFADVVREYWRGHEQHDETRITAALRWLRGEFTTRTDARAALGVRTIVDDANITAILKIMARFVRLAGFAGLLVCLDEMVNLYKLASTQARTANYECLLHMLNDSLQGTAVGCGFVLGGTPEFLMDDRRGLYSYAALHRRLQENPLAVNGLVDYSGPVIRLAALTPEDIYLLLEKLRHLYASGDRDRYLVTNEEIHAFMNECNRRIGDAFFLTPGVTVKEFVGLLALLAQNPGTRVADLLPGLTIKPAAPGPGGDDPGDPPGDDDDLSSFRL